MGAIQADLRRIDQRRVVHVKLARFRHRVETWGWRRAAYWLFMHGVARFLGIHIHYVRVGADRPDLVKPEPPQIPDGYEIRLVKLEDLLPYADRLSNLSRPFLEEAFAGDDECSAAFHGRDLVGFAFTKRSRAPVNEQIDVIIPPGFRYGYKSWTHPDHRRRNISRAMSYIKQTEANRPFNERGISYIETHNYASLLHSYRSPSERSIAMGFTGWITLAGRQIPFNTRKARWIGLEFVRKGDHRVRQMGW